MKHTYNYLEHKKHQVIELYDIQEQGITNKKLQHTWLFHDHE